MTDWIEPEDLAAIPEGHRRAIARWLAQLGSVPAGGLLGNLVRVHNDSLRGAAVTLADPLAEDATIGHAAEVLAELGARPGSPVAERGHYQALLRHLIASDEPCRTPFCTVTQLGHLLADAPPELVALVRALDPAEDHTQDTAAAAGESAR